MCEGQFVTVGADDQVCRQALALLVDLHKCLLVIEAHLEDDLLARVALPFDSDRAAVAPYGGEHFALGATAWFSSGAPPQPSDPASGGTTQKQGGARYEFPTIVSHMVPFLEMLVA